MESARVYMHSVWTISGCDKRRWLDRICSFHAGPCTAQQVLRYVLIRPCQAHGCYSFIMSCGAIWWNNVTSTDCPTAMEDITTKKIFAFECSLCVCVCFDLTTSSWNDLTCMLNILSSSIIHLYYQRNHSQTFYNILVIWVGNRSAFVIDTFGQAFLLRREATSCWRRWRFCSP